MAEISQLTSIQKTNLSEEDIRRLESALGAKLPDDIAQFLLEFGYASFIDEGLAYIEIGTQDSAFGQFYGKRPGVDFDPYDFNSGALRLGDGKSHYPEKSLVFAGDELGGEYFLTLSMENTGIYWMIYGGRADYEWVCGNFAEFMSLIKIDPYDDE